MSTLYLNRLLKHFSTIGACLLRLVFLDGLQQFLFVFFLCQLRVVYSSPTLSLCLFEVFLKLPPSLMVGAIMQVKAAVSEGTVARVMPILAEVEHIVESTGILNS